MTTNKYPRGSEWRKWDLHVHTPASDGTGTPEEIVNKAIEKGLSVIAITDHHSVDYIDQVKEAAKDKDLSVISGIEFRSEYGSKSVHFIGYFPDEFGKTILNATALKDLILSPLGLSRTSIVAKGKEQDSSLNDNTAFKKGMFQVQVDFKAAADLIHQYGGIISVHNGSKENGLDKEVKHFGKAPKNAHSLYECLGTLKEELMKDYVDICDIEKEGDDEEFYLNTFSKPSILTSDAHKFEDIGCRYTWIKADPTFEGLKQVMYEPKERVRIQTTIPDDKNIYQVIDKVVLNEEGFWNSTIFLNSNLNTIIGGRSTGKSNLLKAIAAVHNHPSIEDNDFIMKHLGGVTIQWKDGTDQIGREIDYFKQSYMHDIASKANKTSELVDSIIRNRDTSGVLNMYYAHLNDVSRKITEQMFSLFQTSKELSEKRKELTALGKKDGVVQQINILKTKVDELQKTSKFTLEQQALFDANMQKIKTLNLEIEKADNDLRILEKLLIVTPFDFSFEKQWQMDKLSFRLNQYDLLREYKNLKIKTEQVFIALVRKYQEETIHAKNEIQEQCRVIKESETFKNGIKFIEGNKELKDISDRITAEEKKLALIEQLEAVIEKIRTDCNTLFTSIIDIHCSIKEKAEDVENQLNISYDGLSITVKLEHHRDSLQSFLEDRLNLRGNERQDYCIKIVRNYDSDNRTYAKDFLNKLIKGELQLKNGYEALNVATEFFAKSWYSIGFELCYQGDSFKQMSEGKQAFVILKLLLDFSEKKCPILIDQPEDSLDNRAIYNELVAYIKRKKRERQIILVTHNSNVVVSADAENVIVANQEGTDSHNKDGLRFQYVNGALEDTQAKDINEPSVLNSQGIREHVCDILEGGVEAFKKREQKYGI